MARSLSGDSDECTTSEQILLSRGARKPHAQNGRIARGDLLSQNRRGTGVPKRVPLTAGVARRRSYIQTAQRNVHRAWRITTDFRRAGAAALLSLSFAYPLTRSLARAAPHRPGLPIRRHVPLDVATGDRQPSNAER